VRVLILNQAFHPDVVATGQYAADVATALVELDHEVTVLCSAHGYDSPSLCFPPKERWKGVNIVRVAGTRFGKTAKWRRALDFASFLAQCAWHAPRLGRFDAIVALTTPPLISTIGVACKFLSHGRLIYWTMDLNPDEAILAGWLDETAWTARALTFIQNFSLHHSDAIVALDTFMRDHLIAAGTSASKVFVVPPWPQEDVRYDEAGREEFRRKHGLHGKFVVMYSGNHSPCHPLHTLLKAAEILRRDKTVMFAFVGGGSEHRRLQQAAETSGLHNLRFLPYQPREHLSAALSAADLHTVVMGSKFVGIVHPSKIYNILAVGAPVLYIGPTPSHVTDIFGSGASSCAFYPAKHGQADLVAGHILRAADARSRSRVTEADLCVREGSVQRMADIITGELARGSAVSAQVFGPVRNAKVES